MLQVDIELPIEETHLTQNVAEEQTVVDEMHPSQGVDETQPPQVSDGQMEKLSEGLPRSLRVTLVYRILLLYMYCVSHSLFYVPT